MKNDTPQCRFYFCFTRTNVLILFNISNIKRSLSPPLEKGCEPTANPLNHSARRMARGR